MRLLFVLFCIVSFSFAKSELYVLPQEADQAKDAIVELINDSQKSITIAMYNFSYKKFAKALVKAQKRGVEISVVFDKKKIKEEDSLYKYLKNKGIKAYIADEKMHLKVGVFDNETLLIGSTNFTKKSFSENYEVLMTSQNGKHIKKLNAFIEKLK